MKIFAHISWFIATFFIFLSLATMIVIFPFIKKPYARKVTSWLLKYSIFYRTDIEGKEDPDAQLFLINHQSDLDIAIIETISKKDLAWVAKKSLFDMPFFGLALKLPNDIAVERESKTSLLKLLKDVKDRLDTNRTITMFPEGTRSTNGTMRSFKSGAKVIADRYSLKVQPIVLIQTAKYYNIKKFYYKPGTIKVIYMDSFIADRSDKEWLKDLKNKMQRVYDNELANNPSHR